MDCETVRLDVTIPKTTYDEVLRLTKNRDRGAPLDNTVANLLNLGIAATYKKWPNLKG